MPCGVLHSLPAPYASSVGTRCCGRADALMDEGASQVGKSLPFLALVLAIPVQKLQLGGGRHPTTVCNRPPTLPPRLRLQMPPKSPLRYSTPVSRGPCVVACPLSPMQHVYNSRGGRSTSTHQIPMNPTLPMYLRCYIYMYLPIL